MPRDVTTKTKAMLAQVESLGYRVGIGEQDGHWIATAKRDTDGQFHVSKAASEREVIDGLLHLVGIPPASGTSIK